jgi:hypothetical protein
MTISRLAPALAAVTVIATRHVFSPFGLGGPPSALHARLGAYSAVAPKPGVDGGKDAVASMTTVGVR